MSDPTRPVAQLFDAVVGQPLAVAALRSAARRPVHAYLFCGPVGSGRAAAARAFATALLCATGGCGVCEDCRRALDGTHPDLVVVERAGAALGVDEARTLVGLAQRRPLVSSRQVIVVHDVHLAVRAAPALLKTVEEPPPSTVFVLLAEAMPPDLATVASRCVEVAFPALPAAEVARWLIDQGVTASRAQLVAEGARGSLERARLLSRDEGYAARMELWRSVPAHLDGHGATAGLLARQLLEAAESALEPVRARHADELAQLAADAESMGERGVPNRREITDRQHREERRWRTEEIRTGLGVLSRAYLDRISATVSSTTNRGPVGGPGAPEGAGYARSVDLITEAAAALKRNPNETLLLEALLVQLGEAGG